MNKKKIKNCLSENVVYAVFCTLCNKFLYIGETGDTLYQRMSLNYSRIRTGRDDQLCNHFREKGQYRTFQSYGDREITRKHGLQTNNRKIVEKET